MKKAETGFTLMELMVTIAIFAILCAIAVPNYIGWLPGYRLRSAAEEIRSDLQLAKMRAIKENHFYVVVFNAGNDSYQVVDCGDDHAYNTADDVVQKTVRLTDHGSGVGYGHPSGSSPISGTFDDDITFTQPAANVAMFSPAGLAQTSSGAFSSGYVYVTNNRDDGCAVGTNTLAGNIVLRTWDGGSWN